jgi:hypothetical protein
MELCMRPWKPCIRLALTTSIILLLSSCGGSDNHDEPSDSTTDSPTIDATIDEVTDPQNQDSSILKVSDLRTAANPPPGDCYQPCRGSIRMDGDQRWHRLYSGLNRVETLG